MEDEIHEIIEEYRKGEMSSDDAIYEILRLFSVSKRCSHCLYRKYRPNAKHRYELNQCQISGHNLTDVENHSCEHYKPISNVC